MGNTCAKKEPSAHEINKNWDLVERGDSFNIMRDREGNQGQQYNYVLNNRYDPESQLAIYQKRRTANAPLIKSLAAEYSAKGSALNPSNNVRVITERIPMRLSDAPQLTYPQSLYVLKESLNGYQHLYNNAGVFDVNSDMIGFTKQGHAKVWLNENYSLNHPSHQKNVLTSTLNDRNYLSGKGYVPRVSPDQSQMVRNIVKVVQDHCQQGQFPNDFRSRIEDPTIGFKQARAIIDETTTNEKIFVPQYIDFINNIVRVNRTVMVPGQRKVQVTNTVLVPGQQNIVQKPINTTGYRFEYHQPQQLYHPNIFASRTVL